MLCDHQRAQPQAPSMLLHTLAGWHITSKALCKLWIKQLRIISSVWFHGIDEKRSRQACYARVLSRCVIFLGGGFTSRQLKLTLHSCCCTRRLKWKLRDPICSSVMTVLFEGRKGSSGAAGIFPCDLLAFLPSPSDRCVNSIISKEPWINNWLWTRANLKRWRNVAAAFFLSIKHLKRTQATRWLR